jgi:parallel beta-helix repeat protein
MAYGLVLGQMMTVQSNSFQLNCTDAWIYSENYYGRWSVIDSNTFQKGASGGTTEHYAQISLNGCFDIKITNNIFYNGMCSGIYLGSSCHNITISGNTFDYLRGDGIYSWAKNTTISGNIFRSIPPGFASNKRAIYLRATAYDTSVVNNYITGCERGINTAGALHGKILDNTILQITDSGYIINGFGITDIIRNNIGYLTEAWGNTSVANNGTISHGLASTPSVVFIQSEYANLTFAVWKKSSTTFTVIIRDVNTHTSPSGSYYVFWYAKV